MVLCLSAAGATGVTGLDAGAFNNCWLVLCLSTAGAGVVLVELVPMFFNVSALVFTRADVVVAWLFVALLPCGALLACWL